MPLFGKNNKYTLVKIKKKDIPEGLWTKCADCNTPTYTKVLKDNFSVCPKCQAHFNITAAERVKLLIDEGTFEEKDTNLFSNDPLDFKGPKTYPEKLKEDPMHKYGKNSFELFSLPIIKPNTIVGIIGRNGIGKSSSLQILTGSVKPNLGNYEKEIKEDEIIKKYSTTWIAEYFHRLIKKRGVKLPLIF